MQSRSFFAFGASFNILTDSVFASQFKLDSSTLPPIATFLVTEANNPLITEGGDHFIIE